MDPLEFYIQMNKFDQNNGLILTAKEPGDIQYEMKITEKPQ